MSAAHCSAHRGSGDVIAGHHGEGQGHLLQVSQYFHNVSLKKRNQFGIFQYFQFSTFIQITAEVFDTVIFFFFNKYCRKILI